MRSYTELLAVFGRIGLMSFGGPAAQIALMHRELVEDRNWLDEQTFLRALSFCMLLPGPEAMQLATYAGWRLRGIPGGLIGGLCFVMPGALVIAILAFGYARFGDVPALQVAFVGIKACVVVIVIEALIKVSKRALKSQLAYAIAAAAFVALYVFQAPFPAVIVAAGLVGAWQSNVVSTAPMAPLRLWPSVRILAVGLVIWWAPVAVVALQHNDFLLQIGLFFSKLAVVTFGGAYSVLAYMTQAVVGDFSWLTAAQMMDALGLAETTPGPLILVTQFVAMVAADGTAAMIAAGTLTLWVTFVPCFIWIFAGAPLIDWLQGQPRLQAALSGITAAVVGVIGSLALWFGLQVLFAQTDLFLAGPIAVLMPIWPSFQMIPATIGCVAAWLLLVRHVGLIWVLGISALLALVISFA